MTSNKNLLPALIGIALGLGIALGGAGWYVFEIMSLSFRTYGTPFSKYSTEFNTPKVDPRATYLCDPAYNTRWAGCNMK